MDFFKFSSRSERREKLDQVCQSTITTVLCNAVTSINIIFTFALFGLSMVFSLHTNNSEMKQLLITAVLHYCKMHYWP